MARRRSSDRDARIPGRNEGADPELGVAHVASTGAGPHPDAVPPAPDQGEREPNWPFVRVKSVHDGWTAGASPGATLAAMDDESTEPVRVDTFDRFFRAEVAAVQRSLTVTLGDADLAADATAEAMERAFARWSKVGAYDNPAAWVYRVGLNWATSRWRKHRREVLAADRADVPAEVTTTADPELARALARLEVDQRAVVVLRYHLDWSEADTATALGIAPGTVKSRLSRALARLAVMLEEHDGRAV